MTTFRIMLPEATMIVEAPNGEMVTLRNGKSYHFSGSYRGESVGGVSREHIFEQMTQIDDGLAAKKQRQEALTKAAKDPFPASYVDRDSKVRDITVRGVSKVNGAALVTYPDGEKGSLDPQRVLKRLDRNEVVDLESVLKAYVDAADARGNLSSTSIREILEPFGQVEAVWNNGWFVKVGARNFFADQYSRLVKEVEYSYATTDAPWAINYGIDDTSDRIPVEITKPDVLDPSSLPSRLFRTEEDCQAWIDADAKVAEVTKAYRSMLAEFRLNLSDLGEGA